jgi:hypothetical protein
VHRLQNKAGTGRKGPGPVTPFLFNAAALPSCALASHLSLPAKELFSVPTSSKTYAPILLFSPATLLKNTTPLAALSPYLITTHCGMIPQ